MCCSSKKFLAIQPINYRVSIHSKLLCNMIKTHNQWFCFYCSYYYRYHQHFHFCWNCYHYRFIIIIHFFLSFWNLPFSILQLQYLFTVIFYCMNLELVLFSRTYLSISLCVWYSVGVCLYFIVKVNIKRRYVDKSIFLCIWRRVSCTTFLLYTFSSHVLV